jgi:carbonic anhydrase/acetyltransferase-like protein (isoleucine patch superfamily)
MSATILPYKGVNPRIAASAFVAPTAAVIGRVEIADDVSIWYSCALRGDVHDIKIGKGTNVQDGTVIHGVEGQFGTFIGENVTIGHAAVIHGCIIEDWVLVGMGATVMEGVVVETGAWVAAGALVTPGKRIRKGELWAGMPAKLLRPVKPEEDKHIRWVAGHYQELAREHMKAVAAASNI